MMFPGTKHYEREILSSVVISGSGKKTEVGYVAVVRDGETGERIVELRSDKYVMAVRLSFVCCEWLEENRGSPFLENTRQTLLL